MKRTFFVALLLALVAASARAQGAKPDFSGTWQLDIAKSELGPMPPPDSIVSVIDHQDPKLVVKTTQKSSMGEFTNERNITTDGKPATNKLKSAMGEQDVTSTTMWSGAQLVTSYKMDMQGTALEFRDVWDLSADGKVMTISRDVKTEQGPFSQKMVFTKQ
jgi:hypothetical protein